MTNKNITLGVAGVLFIGFISMVNYSHNQSSLYKWCTENAYPDYVLDCVKKNQS